MAVVATELAGDGREALAATLEGDTSELEAVVRRLRQGSREVVAGRLALAAQSSTARAVLRSPSRGARFLAAWMRGLDVRARAAVASELDRATLAAVLEPLAAELVLEPDAQRGASWVVARGRRVISRPLRAEEWTEVLDELDEGPAATGVVALRVERAVRIVGRRGELSALARAVRV